MKKLHQGPVSRARWAALGAAVAVSLGVGGVAVTNAVISSGEKNAFVPIAPCRLFDIRSGSAQIGPRNTPLTAGETYTVQVTGANGNCVIPSDATGVAMNVTAVDGSASSFLTIWPSDAVQPLASNLNWVSGAPPTPNKVDVKLSATGQISLFNNVGTVNVLADVVGYYSDHNHDDRYYTEAEVNSEVRDERQVDDEHRGVHCRQRRRELDERMRAPGRQSVSPCGRVFSCRSASPSPGISGYFIDSNAHRTERSAWSGPRDRHRTLATATTSGTPGLHQLVATLATPDVVNAGEYFLIEFIGGDGTGAHQLAVSRSTTPPGRAEHR